VDLLEHEVAEAALLRLDGVPRDALGDARHGVPAEVRHPQGLRGDRRDVPVLEEHEVPGVREEGGDVRGHVPLTLAEADHEGRPETRRHESLLFVAVEENDGVHPVDLRERRPGGVLERAPVVGLHEVGQDLCVGLGHEAVAGGGEARLQLEVVLDDAVVDDHDPSRAVLVRVGILLGRPAVGRPAGVADAPLAGERLAEQALREVAELARGAPPLEAAVPHDGDAGRIVPAVLQSPQAVEDERHRVATAHVADDATHVPHLLP
jgi:hypothetical protein